MEKIYGYDEELMLKLIAFVRARKNKTLTDNFREFGKENNRSAGTVRNMYYAAAKRSKTDPAFCERYLDGEPILTQAGERFTEKSERETLKRILEKKRETRSVRSAVLKLANGDGKKALRLQNKYRSALKKNAALLDELTKELNAKKDEPHGTTATTPFTDFHVAKISWEIDRLVGRIAEGVRRENARLKREVERLKAENERLTLRLGNRAAEYFTVEEKAKTPN